MKTRESQRAARELLHVTMLVMRSVAAEMRRSRTPLAPPQVGTLMKLSTGSYTVSELARHQAVSLPTMSRSVDMLVRRKFLERSIDEQDRRQMRVRLTPEGKDVVADVWRQSERHVGRILEDLSVDERGSVVAALDVLERILSTPDEPRLKAATRSNGARRHVAS